MKTVLVILAIVAVGISAFFGGAKFATLPPNGKSLSDSANAMARSRMASLQTENERLRAEVAKLQADQSASALRAVAAKPVGDLPSTNQDGAILVAPGRLRTNADGSTNIGPTIPAVYAYADGSIAYRAKDLPETAQDSIANTDEFSARFFPDGGHANADQTNAAAQELLRETRSIPGFMDGHGALNSELQKLDALIRNPGAFDQAPNDAIPAAIQRIGNIAAAISERENEYDKVRSASAQLKKVADVIIAHQ